MPSRLAIVRSLVLPVTAAGIVPWLLVGGGDGVRRALGDADLPRAFGGALLMAAGLAMLSWTVVLFVRVGHGTLAPWDPTRKLVVVGPYRHVRNPMISGVFAVLLGEVALLGARPLAIWAAAFFVINHVYFLLSEEPGLERRFGDEYRAYRARVPRWIPRVRGYPGPGVGRSSA